ncbi:MAG: D-beta-D-heptose 7-phosphate kinase / D-beta-D-heptose 1-phosphate adenosyltransferase [Actinomycetota bacterium]|nr:D-beta-D-heptose 7-phosphate kinase / D-beta-D-heptose 1-phosphate adenosyltransferase [Actinomycetota bacterium]
MTRSIVVIGDTLLDRDIVGSVSRVCTDSPAPIVLVEREEARPGGAGLAALLGRRAGAHVTLVTALASDASGQLLRRLLTAAGVDIVDLGRTGPTIEKVRVVGGDAPMLRFDRDPGHSGHERWPNGIDEVVSRADAVLIADYATGLTTSPRLRALLERHVTHVPTVWDPHPRGPQPVRNVQLVTPTERELFSFIEAGTEPARMARIERAANRYRTRIGAGAIAVTMGAGGAMLVDGGDVPMVAPARPVARADTVGAGDCFALTAADRLARGAVVSEAVEAAVHGATRFVARGGVARLRQSSPPRRDRADAASLVSEIRAAGGTVVATGGCFDLLHAGHVSMLQSARRLGDCLVVLLNSDESVRRLKGRDRPCQTAADRAEVLLALECVDAVEIFHEDNPGSALERLRPDIFAKGADYAAGPLPERTVVARWGGQAVLLPYLAGRSTTRLVQEMSAHDH